MAGRSPVAEGTWGHQLFLQKTARSVTEIQPRVASVDEVMVFLEVLGYDDGTAAQAGFRDLYDLARRVFEFTSFYDTRQPQERAEGMQVKSPYKRLAEGLGMSFAWLSSLILLYTTGVSFWMGWKVPLVDMTSIVVGAFIGVVLTEGPVQAFSRLFLLNYNQLNITGSKLAIKRSLLALLAILIPMVSVMFAVGAALSIPLYFVAIAAVSMITISWNKVSMMTVYALEKVKVIVVSYSAGVAVVLLVFNLATPILPDLLTRYFAALGAALLVMSIAPLFVYYSLFLKKPRLSPEAKEVHFYRQPKMSTGTLTARFRVQFLEVLPFYLYGTFFFVMLFSDRIISWFYNPLKASAGLPLLFNAVYHSGADTALLVMFPVMFVQFVLNGSIHAELYNGTSDLRVAEMAQVRRFLAGRYFRLIEGTLAVSVPLGALLILFAPTFVTALGGSPQSAIVLRVAALSNVLISMFAANVSFMTLLGRARQIALISGAGAAIVIGLGLVLGSFGFEYIVFAYLASAALTAAASSIYVAKLLNHSDEYYFSRFS